MLSSIFAMGQNRVIGRDNQLPWRLPEDLKYFRRITTGHAIIMGRKTYESIGKPLPNRRNIVLTTQANYEADGCEIAHSIEEVLAMIDSKEEAFIIGGAKIYELLFPYTSKMYITQIQQEFKGDAFFPTFDESEWKQVEVTPGVQNEENPYQYEFQIYVRSVTDCQ
ncbi:MULTISPECIES: dihydrofolate reductase [Brevibacillus]|uniref:dihydrofolate reductase n=1 Tax=Brevibacillus TaxID=55080 RepID=UPI000B9A9B90|nr:MULTISPECIES: dihydrofolate reductase [Brevibacillus]MBG9789519.1 dihydrofolate reductase [Brevibacillus laterosporus]MED1789378.1 dihydrofolate reductase [Brevibacillus laterosporus]RFB34708.1 dihydrofolate reductase [Brevibacillus sp. VP]